MAGDITAAKLVLPYMIGQPATTKELETEIASEPIGLEHMADDQLKAFAQGKYQPSRKYVYDTVIEVVETVVSSRN